MELSTLVAVVLPLVPVIYWIVDLSKDVTNKNINGLITKLVAIGAGYLVLYLFSESDINLGTDNVATNARDVLAVMSWQGLALLALVIASTGGTLADFLRARNGADTSVKPTLLPSAAPPGVETPAVDVP